MGDDVVGIEELEDEQAAPPEGEQPLRGRARRMQEDGIWPVDPQTGRAMVPRSLMMPPGLWRLAQNIHVIKELTGTSAYVRQALVSQIVRDAQEDPRVLEAIFRHGQQDVLGIKLAD